MANKYTAYQIPTRSELEELYFNKNMSQTEVGKYFNVSQKVIHSWFRKLGIKSRVAAKRNQMGENNAYWKGNNVSYAAYHKRVEAARGKPHYCEVCGDMDKDVYEWANLTGDYSNVMDYSRMCRSCHREYDKRRPNSSKHVSRTAK